MKRLYCDNAAQKPLTSNVKQAILNLINNENICNPSAIYSCGRYTHNLIEQARLQVARAIGADCDEIYFTSGSTEAINWIIRTTSCNIITTPIEHKAIYNNIISDNEKCIFTLPIDNNGRIILSNDYLASVCGDNRMVVIGYVNNEIGTIQPIEEITKICHRYGSLIFVDGTQAIGNVPIDVHKLNIDYMCGSFHKLGSLSGCGFLYCKKGSPLEPLLKGGQQENNMRAGTENLFGIVTGGIAISNAVENLETKIVITKKKRNKIISELLKIPNSCLNGGVSNRVANNINIAFDGVEAENLVLMLDNRGIQCSSGSACNSKSLEPSHVLRAINNPNNSIDILTSSIRITIDEKITSQEISYLISTINSCVEYLRKNKNFQKNT